MIEIRKNVSKEKWYHCKSEENPADIITREDKNPMTKLWWNGPKFLYNEEEFKRRLKIRNNPTQHPEFEAELRIKTDLPLVAGTKIYYTIGNVIDINRYNDLLKLLKVTALVFRFINNFKVETQSEVIGAHQICYLR